MIRFVDVRGQGIGYRFAFWDTVTDKFICISTEYAWDTWEDFKEIASGCSDLARYEGLCPEWVFKDANSSTEDDNVIEEIG